MNNDDFDDGLVHGHDWAKEPPPSGVLLPAEPREVDDPKLAEAMNSKQAEG